MSGHEEQIAEFLARAQDSLEAAAQLLASGFPDYAASRAYYAAFYSASAVLMASGEEFRRHSGVIAHIHKDFIRTGRLPAELGEVLNWLFGLRGVGDYGGPAHVERAEAEKAVAAARRFVEAVRKLVP